MNIKRFFKEFINPKTNFSHLTQRLPTLWLLGKTGAGKSSLIHVVTGISRVQIGNGFSPCTMTACSYDFPEDAPLLRFLDTRGLADANYNPGQDIEACQKRAGALIIVMKAQEPDQGEVIKALELVSKSGRISEALLVHTGIYMIQDPMEREKAISHNQNQAVNAWGRPIESVAVDFEMDDGSCFGVDALRDKLADRLPIVAQLTRDQNHADQEIENFIQVKPLILWHARIAGASDIIPIAGTVSVPALQVKMLHAIAARYNMKWDRQKMAGLVAALGSGFAIRYGAKLGIRQLVKLIPVYGQTVGSAAAAVVSFSSTYAIGRAACKYIYHTSRGEQVPEEELRAIYKKAFEDIRRTAESEAGN